ncbi:Tyrosine--tRNA ligase [Meloidogyne graminicola]|uniref:Tyrosine--tRNA ligase n=1 Tax=Meloidogyne graminicola TaxID=189291 RepID=A0A8T0A2A3_9BILA|nr:Tyrosine--tRNA ligase [Meloidogyne graminicola]
MENNNTTKETEKQEQLNEEQNERKNLIIRNLQEVLGEDKLTKQIISGKNIHLYWGTATTGRPHVGYFVPIQKITDFLRADFKVTILFADLHASLDNLKSNFELLENRLLYYEHVIKALMTALNVPLEKLHFVRGQSYQLTELYTKDLLRLTSIISLRDAIKAGAEVIKQMEDPLLSGILYPLLQALDEQYLKVDGQFGGVDQRKIFILAEEQLPRLKLGKRFHLMNPMVPGLTGSKMSSSDEYSKIDLLDAPHVVNLKIDSANCPSIESGEENGVLAFYKHVVFPIVGKSIEMGQHLFSDFSSLQSAFAQEILTENILKNYLQNFLNEILAKVQENCFISSEFKDIVIKAYPKIGEKDCTDEDDESLSKIDEEILSFVGPLGDNLKFIPSKSIDKPSKIFSSPIDSRPLKVLWRCSPKGLGFTLAHVYALIQLKFLHSKGFDCSILISDLDAFLDKLKCPWQDLKKRMDNYLKILKQLLVCLGMPDLNIINSNEYEYESDFTLKMYQSVSVVTRDQASLIEGANTVGTLLCPIYFALDLFYGKYDIVLIGPHQINFAKLALKINKSLKQEVSNVPAFIILPEIPGTDGLRMSITKPDFNLNISDGLKKFDKKLANLFVNQEI